jgi:AhpD family alkylhydroperoxidase
MVSTRSRALAARPPTARSTDDGAFDRRRRVRPTAGMVSTSSTDGTADRQEDKPGRRSLAGPGLSHAGAGRCPMVMTTTRTRTNEITETERRRARIRVPVAMPRGVVGKAVTWYSRRTFGDVLDPALVMDHHRRIMFATFGFEGKVAKWKALDADLKNLAQLAAAGTIGCSWCMDFGYFAAHSSGHSVEKLKEVPRWRESDVFTDVEREVLAYAEAMTVTPPEVTDAMVDGLVARLGVPAVVELTKMVSVENERSRFNSAMGLTSQGFSDRCELPGG